jgi:LysM repeat protein
MAADQAKNTQPVITNTNTYQVQKSDTLYSIARKYNTSVEELKVKNNLEGTELKPGQTLVIAD